MAAFPSGNTFGTNRGAKNPYDKFDDVFDDMFHSKNAPNEMKDVTPKKEEILLLEVEAK